MKLIVTHIATLAFDNHQVTLVSEDAEILIRFKDAKNLEDIEKRDEVELLVSKVTAKKVAALDDAEAAAKKAAAAAKRKATAEAKKKAAAATPAV